MTDQEDEDICSWCDGTEEVQIILRDGSHEVAGCPLCIERNQQELQAGIDPLDLRAFLARHAVLKDKSWPVTWSVTFSCIAQWRDDNGQLTPTLDFTAALARAIEHDRPHTGDPA